MLLLGKLKNTDFQDSRSASMCNVISRYQLTNAQLVVRLRASALVNVTYKTPKQTSEMTRFFSKRKLSLSYTNHVQFISGVFTCALLYHQNIAISVVGFW